MSTNRTSTKYMSYGQERAKKEKETKEETRNFQNSSPKTKRMRRKLVPHQ